MAPSPLASAILFHLGPLAVTRPVVTTWAIMAVLALASWLVTRRLRLHPDRRQTVLELIVAESDLGRVIGRQGRMARSLRTIVKAAALRTRKRYQLEIVE